MTTEVVVGRVGRPHGVRGEFVLVSTTDEPERRFAPGALVRVAGRAKALEVAGSRRHGDRLLVRLVGVADREAAQALAGAALVADVDADERPDDPEEHYDRHLVGARVVDPGCAELGAVVEVRHMPAQDLLVVQTPSGRRSVPFVSQLVVGVDLAAGVVTVDAPPGLLDDEGVEAR